MALLQCPGCGKMISENAYICPKCGTVLKEKSSQIIPKWMFIVCLIVLLLGGASLGYFYWLTVNENASIEKAAVEKAKKETELSLRYDSLYNDFITQDLLFVDAKGFVKSLKTCMIRSEENKKIIDWGFVFEFDKKGNIIDIKANQGLNDYSFVTANFTRGDNNIIDSLDYKDIGNLVEQVFSFKYGNNGHVIIMENRTIYSMEYDVQYYTYSNYVNGQGFLGYKKTGNYGYDFEYKEDGTFSNVNVDANGNWISKSCVANRMETEEEGDEVTTHTKYRKIALEQVRTITYYDKSEIDFSQFIKQ